MIKFVCDKSELAAALEHIAVTVSRKAYTIPTGSEEEKRAAKIAAGEDIQNELKKTPNVVECDVNELAESMGTGHCVRGIIHSPQSAENTYTDRDGKKHFDTSKAFIKQTVYLLDFDNKTVPPRPELQTADGVREFINSTIAEHIGQPVNAVSVVSESVSSSAELRKWHAALVLETPINDFKRAKRIITYIVNDIFGGVADSACTDPARLIFGSDPEKITAVYDGYMTADTVTALEKLIEEKERERKEKAAAKAAAAAAKRATSGEGTEMTADRLAAIILNARCDFGAGGYSEFLTAAAALYHLAHIPSEAIAAWGETYDGTRQNPRQWESMNRDNSITIGTLKYAAMKLNESAFNSYKQELYENSLPHFLKPKKGKPAKALEWDSTINEPTTEPVEPPADDQPAATAAVTVAESMPAAVLTVGTSADDQPAGDQTETAAPINTAESGTPSKPAAAADDQTEDTTTSADDNPAEIKKDPEKWTGEQWEEAYQYNFDIPHQTENVLNQFIRLYKACFKNKYLYKWRLPEYIQPVIKQRREDGAIYSAIVGFKINPVPLARDLVRTLHAINITSSVTGLLYIYENGRYTKIDPEQERGIIRKRLENLDRGAHIWDTKTVKDCMLMLHSPSKVHKLDDFNANESIINFQNGLLNINTGEITPHTPDELTTIQLPLIYDPNAGTDTPTFDKMIEHLSSGREDVKKLLLQMCALAISNINVSNYKVFLLIFGAKDSGKSKIFSLLSRLLGNENVHSTSLYLLEENRFEPMNLYGKRFAGHAELDNNSVVHHVGTIKALTGGDLVRGEVKGGGTFNFMYKGVIVFSSNDKPYLPSADNAFYDRLRLVEVPQTVKEKDPELLKKMWGERQQIINKLLPYLKEVITANAVIDPESSIKEKRKYRAENAIEISFFNDCCCMRSQLQTITDSQTKQWIYDKFREYCDSNGVKAKNIPSKPQFEKRIEQYFISENLCSCGIEVRKKYGRFYTFTYHDPNVTAPATLSIQANDDADIKPW